MLIYFSVASSGRVCHDLSSRYEGNEIYFQSQLSTLMEKKNTIFLTWRYSLTPLARLCGRTCNNFDGHFDVSVIRPCSRPHQTPSGKPTNPLGLAASAVRCAARFLLTCARFAVAPSAKRDRFQARRSSPWLPC
jgi:hypothetical protein